MDKINFTNGKAPAINATNLNQMQTNVEAAIETAKNELKEVVLYESEGSKENITLNDSVENYYKIVIYYGNLTFNRHNSTEIINPNGKQTTLTTNMRYSDNNAFYTYFDDVSISGVNINQIAGGYFAVQTTGGIEYYYNANQISIYKVVGYK